MLLGLLGERLSLPGEKMQEKYECGVDTAVGH